MIKFLRIPVFAAVASCAVLAPSASALGEHPAPGVGQGAGVRYATDAYPGFDNEKEIVSPERKTPRWFGFIFGPNCEDPGEQLRHCIALVKEGSYSRAARQLDALVREWPTSPEAPKAQQALAELYLNRLHDYEEAFAAFRYLLDFHSLQCDYDRMVDKLYQVAGLLKAEGKEVMFVRFANTVDVRRAYEACVLHAPGAKWVPEAMMTIGSLREDEGRYEEAVKVYETLRNLHPASPEARESYLAEAEDRMVMVHERGYNRNRCRDTIAFLTMALRGCRPSDVERIQTLLAEAKGLLEGEAYRGAKFYDSPTRTVRSAINAYEKFLAEYPESVHAEEIKARLEELKEKLK